jgi:hypothetical protein
MKTSRARDLSGNEAIGDINSAVSHRLRRAVENPRFQSRTPGLREVQVGEVSADDYAGFPTALAPARRHAATTTAAHKYDRLHAGEVVDGGHYSIEFSESLGEAMLIGVWKVVHFSIGVFGTLFVR